MRPPHLLFGLVLLLLACGLSFGAGYFMAKQESNVPRMELADVLRDPEPAPKPEPRPEPEPDKPQPEAPAPQPTRQAEPEPAKTEVEAEAPKPTEDTEDERRAVIELEAMELALEQGEKVDLSAVISGIVTDSHGVGVAGAVVRGTFNESFTAGTGSTIRLAFASSGNQGEPLATTDGAGYYRIDVSRKVREKASLMVHLMAGATGYADSNSRAVSLTNGQTVDNINLQLRQAGRVTGRVVDQTGRGVEGVRVSLGGNAPGRLVIESGFGGPSAGTPSATTDSGGEYVIDAVPEGTHALRMSGTGHRQVSGPTSVDVKAGADTRAPADFVVAVVSSLRATFQADSGEAVRGWATLSFKDNAGTNVKRMSGMIGADGTFEANEPPVGSFTVEISVRGYEPASVHASVYEGMQCDLGPVTLTRNQAD